jgi:galactokinase
MPDPLIEFAAMSATAPDIYGELKDQFVRLFGPGGKIHLVRAPGRVNLIGEHTDYNQGLVFPIAIEPKVVIACRNRADDLVKVASTVFPGEFVEFSLRNKIDRARGGWSNYVRGTAAELIAAGIPLSGMDALISNTLAVGSGLASSAAIEIGFARAILLLAGLTVDIDRLALICQKGELEYAQVPCGIMDQMIVAGGRAGYAMLLDCRDLSRQFIPIDSKELRVAVVNSMVKHEHSGGEYPRRRRQCEEGVAVLQRRNPAIKSLRDATLQDIESSRADMSEIIYRRCRHVISENSRTATMAQELARLHYDAVGELMVQSHHSLRDDYEVSCAELDFLVEQSLTIKGVYGARMTGGGFGGCIVALAQPRAVEPLTQHIHQAYTAKFDRQPSILITSATAGASAIG